MLKVNAENNQRKSFQNMTVRFRHDDDIAKKHQFNMYYSVICVFKNTQKACKNVLKVAKKGKTLYHKINTYILNIHIT